jgi:hypothetical protein
MIPVEREGDMESDWSRAERALRDARALAHANRSGVAQVAINRGKGHLDVLVQWDARTKEYEVGDAARVYATGKRSVAMAAIEEAMRQATVLVAVERAFDLPGYA